MLTQKLKNFANQALHNPCTKSARIINGALIFLIIFSIAVIPLHFLPDLAWSYDILFLFDQIIVTIFTVEYVLRIWSARDKRRYIFSWWGLIDLMAILPFYLSKFGLVGAPYVFLILRLLRILKLGKIYEMEHSAIEQCATKKHGEFEALPGEQIIRIVQKHPVIFLLALIMPLIFTTIGLSILVFFNAHIFAVPFAVLFFAFAAVFFIKAWLDFNYDVIYVTNKRVILQDRELFGSVKNDIAYEAITNTIPQNLGISHWLLGFGHIQIETAAADGNFLFENAPDPHGVVRLIVQNRHEALEKSIGNPTIRTEITKPSVTKI